MENELELWGALVATLAYWGDQQTDDWWISSISYLAVVPVFSGSTDANDALKAPTILALYAAGVAAAAAGRWETVVRILTDIPVLNPYSGRRSPVAALFKPDDMYPHSNWASRKLFRLLQPLLADVVGLGSMVDDAWEKFEYIGYALDLARGTEAKPVSLPYLQVDDDRSDGRRETVPVVAGSVRTLSALIEGVNPHIDNTRFADFFAAMDAADSRINNSVENIERRAMPVGVAVWLPSGRRYAAITEDVA